MRRNVYPGVTSSVYLYLLHGAEEAESVNLMICMEYTGEKVRATTVPPLIFDVRVRTRRTHPRARRRGVSRDAPMDLPDQVEGKWEGAWSIRHSCPRLFAYKKASAPSDPGYIQGVGKDIETRPNPCWPIG